MSNGAGLGSRAHSNSRQAHVTFHFLAGLTSGVSSAVLLQPVDLLKTRVQQSRNSSLVPVLRSILSGPSPTATLWRGTVPSALRTGFGSALYFSCLNTLRQLLAVKSTTGPNDISSIIAVPNRTSSVLPKLTPAENLVTGATARVLAGFVLMPVTVIKVRYESDLYAYKSLVGASKDIYKNEGLRGFFTGLGATAVRDAPYAGLYVLFYEAGKVWLNRMWFSDPTPSDSKVSSTVSATINATSGILAATSATAITNPFDAVKTRLQLMPQKYGNMWRAIKIMLKDEGTKSFFDGLGLRMARKAVSSALAWTVYEELIGRAQRGIVDGRPRASATIV